MYIIYVCMYIYIHYKGSRGSLEIIMKDIVDTNNNYLILFALFSFKKKNEAKIST